MSVVADPSLTPVDALPGHQEHLEEGIALCLSGGGYRAMLFHVGAIWRLAELGLLGSADHMIRRPEGSSQFAGTLQRISSVSGGSLTAGMLALKWGTLEVDRPGVAERYVQHVVAPLRALARVTLAGADTRGLWRMLWNIVAPGSVNDHIGLLPQKTWSFRGRRRLPGRAPEPKPWPDKNWVPVAMLCQCAP